MVYLRSNSDISICENGKHGYFVIHKVNMGKTAQSLYILGKILFLRTLNLIF